MSNPADEPAAPRPSAIAWLERIGHHIPDPVLLFAGLWVLTFLAASLLGGHQFEVPGPGGTAVSQAIKPMFESQPVRWTFDNALLQNWLAFGNGVTQLPLERGFYVASDTACGQASSATLLLVHGGGINGSRDACNFKCIDQTGSLSYRVVAACNSIEVGAIESSTYIYEIPDTSETWSARRPRHDFQFIEGLHSHDIAGIRSFAVA